MSQHLVELAELVRERLTTDIGGFELTPERVWTVVEELSEVDEDELKVWIVPVVSQPTDYSDRTTSDYSPLISIVMQQKLSSITNELIDPLAILAGQIVEFWRQPANRSFEMPGIGGWTLQGPEFRDGLQLIPDHLYNLRQFTSVIDLTFRLVG